MNIKQERTFDVAFSSLLLVVEVIHDLAQRENCGKTSAR